jgi:co-chaperonin GroES (HSP10)
MDRILVMVISDDPNEELLEDGSTRNKTTGLISTAKYRQHSNVGIVLLAGQWVVTGGIKTYMNEILSPGDKVIYGDYGSEKMSETFDKKAEALCDSLGINYQKTEQGIRIVRVQDIRTVERKVKTSTFVPSCTSFTYISGEPPLYGGPCNFEVENG